MPHCRPSCTAIFALRYKTELCQQFAQNNSCEYGETCLYAHTTWELRSPEMNHDEGVTSEFIWWRAQTLRAAPPPLVRPFRRECLPAAQSTKPSTLTLQSPRYRLGNNEPDQQHLRELHARKLLRPGHALRKLRRRERDAVNGFDGCSSSEFGLSLTQTPEGTPKTDRSRAVASLEAQQGSVSPLRL